MVFQNITFLKTYLFEMSMQNDGDNQVFFTSGECTLNLS